MKPLLVLLGSFLLTLGIARLFAGNLDYLLAGNVAMAVMLLFTGAAHFTLTQGMVLMLPEWLPARKAWVYFTGVVELVAAVACWCPRFEC
ncbi:hypothetical protein [Hymenobacter sp.]|jgi:uncharacterized membrane protein|uniref:hypothetical protein n=1 Tax=Hymenobacter sp. TaxID=1898978 RepID=UPI002EDB984F